MATKVPYSKLGLKKIENTQTIKVGEFDIEVKQYLPVDDKLALVQQVMEDSLSQDNGMGFMSPIKVDVFGELAIVEYFTNITFTDKQKEDPAKLYDALETNGVIGAVIEAIPENIYNSLIEDIDATIKEFYSYKNSALGVLEAVSADYQNLNVDLAEMQENLSNPENLTLLKDVVNKLG